MDVKQSGATSKKKQYEHVKDSPDLQEIKAWFPNMRIERAAISGYVYICEFSVYSASTLNLLNCWKLHSTNKNWLYCRSTSALSFGSFIWIEKSHKWPIS